MRKLALTILVISLFVASFVYVSHYFREADMKIVCWTNLACIGKALKQYELEHHAVPANLNIPGVPSRGGRPFLECFASGSKYIYLRNKMDDKPATVVAFELRCVHTGKCGCILFGDGHVECIPVQRHDEIIDAALQEIIQISQSRPATEEKKSPNPH